MARTHNHPKKSKKKVPNRGVEPRATADFLCEQVRGGYVTDTPVRRGFIGDSSIKIDIKRLVLFSRRENVSIWGYASCNSELVYRLDNWSEDIRY